MKEIMYSFNFRTYVEVYQIFDDYNVLFRNPKTHTWETSSIWSLVPKEEWEEFLVFFNKWKDIKPKEDSYKAPKIHIGTKRGIKDKEIFFLKYTNSKEASEYNIYDSYKEAEEAKKIYVFEDYYSFLTKEDREEIIKNV